MVQYLLATAKPDNRQSYDLALDLAPIGSSERVTQLKTLSREIQRLLEDAAAAYKNRLRPPAA